MKILMCAFACLKDPDRRFGFGEGGEGGLGWNMVNQAAKSNMIWVLTDISNKEALEKELRGKNETNIHFIYIGSPWLSIIKKLPGGIQLYSYIWQIKAYFVAKKLYREIGFNIFHHLTYANDWMASFIGALVASPYIRGPGGGAHKIPKSFFTEFSFKDRLSQIIRSIGQWIFRHDPFFIAGQNKAKAILVCNKESLQNMPERWRKKTQLFPVNGVSSKDLTMHYKEKASNNTFTIVSAGKLLQIKGFAVAIKAFKLFGDKIAKAEFNIIGDGPDLERLKALASDLQIKNKVHFLNWMPREKLLSEISSADVFVFPSLRDGGGQVVVEAMAQGKPVICFDIAGPGFHIQDKWGIKVKPDSPEQAIKDMAGAMEKLYYDKKLKESLGKNAKKRAEEFYLWDRLGDKLYDIYKIVNIN